MAKRSCNKRRVCASNSSARSSQEKTCSRVGWRNPILSWCQYKNRTLQLHRAMNFCTIRTCWTWNKVWKTSWKMSSSSIRKFKLRHLSLRCQTRSNILTNWMMRSWTTPIMKNGMNICRVLERNPQACWAETQTSTKASWRSVANWRKRIHKDLTRSLRRARPNPTPAPALAQSTRAK